MVIQHYVVPTNNDRKCNISLIVGPLIAAAGRDREIYKISLSPNPLLPTHTPLVTRDHPPLDVFRADVFLRVLISGLLCHGLTFFSFSSLLVDLLLLLGPVVHELRQEVDGQWEDDGGVLLGRDGVQRLERRGEKAPDEDPSQRSGSQCAQPLIVTIWDICSLHTIILRYSAAYLYKVVLTCKYLSCSADDDSAMTSEASFSALEAFCSPSAAMTLALASLAASASAAIALCSWTGKRASLL